MKIVYLLFLTLVTLSLQQVCDSNNRPTYQQNICSQNKDTLLPSWCNFNNPFTIPYLFSDLPFGPPNRYTCDGTDPYSKCGYISKVRTFEFNQTRRMVFFALKNSTTLAIDFNTNLVQPFYPPIRPILYLEVSSLFLVVGNQNAIAVYSTITESLCQTMNFGDEILNLEVKTIYGNSFLFVLMYAPGGSRMNVYRLDACFAPPVQVVTYPLVGVSDRNVWFSIHSHWYNYTTQIESGSSNHRHLIMLYTETQVTIIDFIPDSGNSFPVNFDGNQLYSFYTAPPGTILQDVGIIAEKMRRINYQNSTCSNVDGLPAQNIFLSVLIGAIGSPPTLNIVILKEFGLYNATTPRSTLNPANRDAICPNQYWDGGSCVSRTTQILTLPEEIVAIDQAYLGETKGVLNSTSRCEILRQYSPDQYEMCRTMESSFQCDLQYYQNVTPDALSQMFDRSMYTVLFIATKETDRILVYGVQPKFCSREDIILTSLSAISFLGDIKDLHVSDNAQHLLVTIERDKWELDSMRRYQDICNHLKNVNPNEPSLLPYKDSCDKTPPMVIDLNQFGQYSSLCFPGTLCSSLTENLISQVRTAHFTFRPNAELLCTPGHYCLQGVKMDCPQGFLCPDPGMTRPKKCDKDSSLTTSCGSANLITPVTCPSGSICTVPYGPGFPAAPGYFSTLAPSASLVLSKRVVANCNPGEYCNLGRSIATSRTELLCPDKTVCVNPSVMIAPPCHCGNETCSYCPPGTYLELPCPAGFKCNLGNSPQIKNCTLSEWCPNGTIIPKTCPPQYFCPTPADRFICPYGYYCKIGTVSPLPCPIAFFCPEGTVTDPVNFLGVLLDVIVIIVVLILYGIATFSLHLYRKYREKRRKMLESGLLRSETQINMKMKTSQSIPMTNCYIDIRFENLGLKLKTTGATVLHNVNGIVKSGRVCAVMGPSGCGKSTFLTTLSGRALYGDQIGDIYINDVKDSLTKYKNLIGFVPQEDIMLRTMSVEDILFFSAYSRLDWRTPRELVTRIVDKTIKQLGLEEIRYQIIGDELTRGISGGQRKRVNIGMELVAKPVVLFLDEPTSGLDSSSSMEVCSALSKIAKTGITVVTVIHQPRYEIFTLIDDVLLLGKGGKVVYHGESTKALGYFENLGFKCPEHVNPPDFFMDVISGDIPRIGDPEFQREDLFEFWRQTDSKIEPSDFDKTRTPKQESRSRKTLFFVHLWLCFWRAFKQQFSNLGGFFLDNCLFFISGLFTGMTFYKATYIGPLPQEIIDLCPDSLRVLCGIPQKDVVVMIASASTLALALSSTIAALKIFGDEIAVFRRENESGMSTIAYFMAKNLVQIFCIFTAPLVFLSIFYSLFVPRGTFASYYFLLMEVVFIGYGFGYLISVTCGYYQQLAAIIITMIFFNFNGTVPTLKQIKEMPHILRGMPYISYLRWMQECVYLIEIGKYEKIYNIQTGMDILDYNFNNLIPNIFIGLAFGVGVRIIAYICLVASAPDSWFSRFMSFIFSIPALIKRMKCCQKKKETNLSDSLIENDSLKRMPNVINMSRRDVLQSEEYFYKDNVEINKVAEVDEEEVTPFE
jgi:ABC-type multidrug transport system ATPase subunit